MYEAMDKSFILSWWAICFLYLSSLFYKPLGLQVRRRQALLRQAWFVVVPLVLSGLHWCFIDELTKFQNNIVVTAAQLIGVGLVIVSIASTLGIFDRRSAWHHTKNWFSEFLRIKSRVHNASIAVKLGGLSLTAGTGLVTTSDNTLDGRIKQIEQKVDHLFTQIKDHYKKLSERITKETQDIKQEINSVTQQVSNLEQNMSATTVSHLTVQICGAILLAYGTIADRFLLPY